MTIKISPSLCATGTDLSSTLVSPKGRVIRSICEMIERMADSYLVLVVDDNPSTLEMSCRALDRAGFEAAPAADFAQMAQVLAQRAPDLILMDVQMPELYGDDVAAVLRDARGVRAKIFLYSSIDTDELAARTKDAGLDGFISKSDGLSALVAGVTAARDAG